MTISSQPAGAAILKRLLATTCLTAFPFVASEAIGQEIDEIGTDLGSGGDRGTVNGGVVDVSGAPTVRGVGVSTGSGSDRIENTGAIDVEVFADDDVVLSGFSASQLGLNVRAEGIGFFGDTGRDNLVNTGDIYVRSAGAGFVTNLGLNLLGFLNYNAPSTVDSLGIGIDGGLAADQLNNRSSVIINSFATISMLGQSPSSYDENALVDITANADAIGMRGTRNGVTTINSGMLAPTATSMASSLALDVEIVNGVVVDSSTNANATVVGIEGDFIRDTISNNGMIMAGANARAFRDSGALSLSDGGVADNSVNATALNTGISGGFNDDDLSNHGLIVVTSDAEVESTNVEINLIDVAGGAFNLAPLAIAKGISGGMHDDTLENAGVIMATTNADSFSNSVNLSLIDATIIGGRISAAIDKSPDEDGAPPIQAMAIGLEGGEGEDVLINNGAIMLTGDANAESVSVAVATIGVPDAAFQAIIAGESLASLDTFASSRIIGMSGGGWDDTLTNLHSITGATTSTAQQVGVAVSTPSGFLPDEAGFLPGFTLGGAGAGTFAEAIGMSGGDGSDMLFNGGVINLTSTANALAVSVSVELPEFSPPMGFGFDLGLTLADVDTEAAATTTGMAGDDGDDALTNNEEGVIDAIAVADSTSTGVGVTTSIEKEGVVSEGVVVRASTDADADATAMDGGAGDDVIINEGVANAMSTATADTFGLTISLEGVSSGGAAGIAAVDGAANANATSQVITGGDGADLLVNTGSLDADATANAFADSVSVALTGAATSGFAGAGTLSISGATATADASGVDWSSNDQGAENRGSITTNANATARGDAISIGVSGTVNGLTLNASLADSSTMATATASAFEAPSGNHSITNLETLSAMSVADADSDSVGVELGVVTQAGLSAGVALTRAVTTSNATSTGITSDFGFDEINNLGTITADAMSKANSTSLAIGLNGTLAGVAINAAAADGSAAANADATGISTGLLDDVVTTVGTVTSKSDAQANSDSIAIEVAVTAQAGVAAGGALARAGVMADATAAGAATGEGADQLAAAGVIDVSATSSADSDAISIAGQGTVAGVSLGAAIVEAQTVSIADASALNGGAGDDIVQNESTLTAASTANANSTSVGVEIGAAGAGLSGGVSLANTKTTAKASTGGIEGGLGADMISNATALDIDSTADGKGASVAVTLVGVLKGVAVGAALTDATVDAESYATGIAGDDAVRPETADDEEEDANAEMSALANADQIMNSGVVTVDSIAKSSGVSVSVAAPVAFVPVGFALATATNTGSANAFGIDGGYGDDVIVNMSDVTVLSDSDVTGASVAVSLTGGALGDFDGKAFSTAYGITGGWGDDNVLNDGVVTTTADANVQGVIVNANLLGASIGGLSTRAQADAIGLFGDIGADMLANESELVTNAVAKAASTNVSVALLGFTLDDLSTKAFANTAGIDGGEDNDVIGNFGTVTTSAMAMTPSVAVSVTSTGAPINDATTRSETTSYGLAGGAGADQIISEGAVTSTSTASTTGTGVSVNLTGAAFVDTTTVADATAIGIAGGANEDVIVNRNAVTSTSTSTTTTTGVGVNLIGASFADADTTSNAHAVGIAGDGGGDEIVNESDITTTSTAMVGAGAVSVSVGGFANGEISTVSNATGAGIAGGDGNDLIGHLGSITTTTIADASAQTVSVGGAGAAFADITLTANTDGAGIDGGAGNDEIVTFDGSDIRVDSKIIGGANNTVVQLVGATSAKNVFGFAPSATGIVGGDGNDFISLGGTADIDAATNFSLRNTSVAILGAAFDNSGITSDPTALGIAGGAGADVINIDNFLDVRALNTFSTNATSFNLAGFTSSKPRVGGESEAIGVDGGDDDDTVVANGRVKTNATSSNSVSGTQVTIAGATQSTAAAGAASRSTGFVGGGGADALLSTEELDVDASATTTLGNSTVNIAGASSAGGSVNSTANGIGQSAGAGDDIAGNAGDLFVDTTSNLTTSGGVTVIFGSASAGASTTATASSSGMLGGDGADQLFNTDRIRARSTSTGSINRTGYVFAGGARTSATASSSSTSLGIGGGAGDDIIENTGGVESRATSTTTASGNTTATVGSARASSTVSASARAVGLSGDDGADFVSNAGNLVVFASANPSSTNAANTGGFFTDGVTDSRTSTTIRAIGIDGGAGANDIRNTGDITIDISGQARSNSTSDGDTLDNIFGLDLDAVARSTASNNGMDARGVSAGSDATSVWNDGVIDVEIRGSGYARANADGDAFADGDGAATATVGVSTARAYGFVAGGGDNTFVNSGTVKILSRPTGNADAISDADGIEAGTQPDSDATANVSLNNVRAAGVWVGDGADIVVNEGSLNVTAEPRASQAEADALFGGDVLGIDTTAIATATVDNASAYGIRAGNGANEIYNAGSITVTSKPRAVANARAVSIGLDGDSRATANARARNAVARGVLTGSGNDLIWNDGSITAISNPSVSATASARGTVGGDEVANENPTTSGRSAIAVSSGSGNDTIVNAGAITATLGTSVGSGVGVNTGSGEDMLALLDGSSVRGSITLNTGNDTLLLSGAPTTSGNPNGGSGTDTVIFDGAGSYSRALSSFEIAQKTGGGIFAIPILPVMQAVDVQNGVLQASSGYAFSNSGAFKAFVDGDGTFGQFAIGGAAMLGGSVEVTAGPGLFADGQSFDVITASSVGGSFSSETLPNATPLLSFDLVQAPQAVRVVASVASFATVAAGNNVDQSFAAQLDQAALQAGGALADTLARIQRLPDGADFATELANLNPARFDDFSRNATETINRFESGARQRLAALRQLSADGVSESGFVGGMEPVRFDQSTRFNLGQGVSYGAWRATFGGLEGAYGESHGSMTGADYFLPSGTVFGASFGAVRSRSIDASFTVDEAQIDSFMMSFYGSQRLGDNGYVDAIVSYGNRDYQLDRPVGNFSTATTSSLDHSGSNVTASIETGRAFAFAGGRSEIFGGMRFGAIDEDGFDALNAGGVAVSLDRRSTNRLETDLGMRVGWTVETPVGLVSPRVSVAWSRRVQLSGDRRFATFADAPGFRFDLPSALQNRDALRLGAGVDLWRTDSVSLSSRVEMDMFDRRASTDGVIEFQWRF
ncbi:MAG: autotransporter outer membrane beta-barrel domain-containing protein [Pseudomonadota bacterium]